MITVVIHSKRKVKQLYNLDPKNTLVSLIVILNKKRKKVMINNLENKSELLINKINKVSMPCFHKEVASIKVETYKFHFRYLTFKMD